MRGAVIPPDRTAHFVCALSLSWPDGEDQVFEGRAFGEVVWPPRGTLGFGYDPMFLPDGEELTFGEMGLQHVREIVHINHSVGDTRVGDAVEHPVDQRDPVERHHRLGDGFGELAHAGSKPGREHERGMGPPMGIGAHQGP